jgi:hypothetical protein
LKDRRATLAGEVIKFKQGIRDREEQLSHLDATLRVLDPHLSRRYGRAKKDPPREAVR